jgi:hypothetical protein
MSLKKFSSSPNGRERRFKMLSSSRYNFINRSLTFIGDIENDCPLENSSFGLWIMDGPDVKY